MSKRIENDPLTELIRLLQEWTGSQTKPDLKEWKSMRELFYRLWKSTVDQVDESTSRSLMVLMDGCEFTALEYVTPQLLKVLLDGLLQYQDQEHFEEGMSRTLNRAIWRAGGRVVGPVSDVKALLS